LRSLTKVVLPIFRRPKPAEKPAGYPDVWPNYFVAAAFVHNRDFGFVLHVWADPERYPEGLDT